MLFDPADRVEASHFVPGSPHVVAALSRSDYERWCGVDDAMMTWLMVPEVQKALHINMAKKSTEHNNLKHVAPQHTDY